MGSAGRRQVPAALLPGRTAGVPLPRLGTLPAPHTGEAGTGASVARGSEVAWREEMDRKIPAKGGTAPAAPAPGLLSRRRWLTPAATSPAHPGGLLGAPAASGWAAGLAEAEGVQSCVWGPIRSTGEGGGG